MLKPCVFLTSGLKLLTWVHCYKRRKIIHVGDLIFFISQMHSLYGSFLRKASFLDKKYLYQAFVYTSLLITPA